MAESRRAWLLQRAIRPSIHLDAFDLGQPSRPRSPGGTPAARRRSSSTSKPPLRPRWVWTAARSRRPGSSAARREISPSRSSFSRPATGAAPNGRFATLRRSQRDPRPRAATARTGSRPAPTNPVAAADHDRPKQRAKLDALERGGLLGAPRASVVLRGEGCRQPRIAPHPGRPGWILVNLGS